MMTENRVAGMTGFTEDNTPESITATDVIKRRQYKVLDEIMESDRKIEELKEAIASEVRNRDMLRMEYDMWENYGDRNQVRVTHTTTTTVELHHGSRMKVDDRMKFEDCLKGVMREAGLPISFGDLRGRLEKFGFIWNNYVSAHNYITRCGLLENAGKKGYYQLMNRK
jgi:hypothetical protein